MTIWLVSLLGLISSERSWAMQPHTPMIMSERTRFIKEEWPAVQQRMKRLGIDAADLLERQRA